MKIVFLDVDGVMNTLKGAPDRKFSKAAVENLKELIKPKDISVVISSSWRKWGFEEMKKMFKENGLDPEKIIDLTGFEAGIRGHQIHCWLDRNPQYKQFVILDDNSDMEPYLTKLVKTNPFVGLTNADVEKAKKILSS